LKPTPRSRCRLVFVPLFNESVRLFDDGMMEQDSKAVGEGIDADCMGVPRHA
jgi:hypothetical protein